MGCFYKEQHRSTTQYAWLFKATLLLLLVVPDEASLALASHPAPTYILPLEDVLQVNRLMIITWQAIKQVSKYLKTRRSQIF